MSFGDDFPASSAASSAAARDVPLRRASLASRIGAALVGVGLRGLAALVLLVSLWYLIGMTVIHKIDDDLTFRPAEATPNGSYAVDMAIALTLREVDTYRWTANDPFFMPSYLMDNMPAWQTGIIQAVQRFTNEMVDFLGRRRGSSEEDPDLKKANGDIRYDGGNWYFNFEQSLLPQATAEQKYRGAAASLRLYNERLAAGEAILDRRADNLEVTLDRIAKELGGRSAVIERHLEAGTPFLFDASADVIFYENKGRLYAYALLLEALGRDFEDILVARELQGVWDAMLDALRAGASLQPAVIVSGAADSQMVPSHLAAQGYYLLNARTRLREIGDILLK